MSRVERSMCLQGWLGYWFVKYLGSGVQMCVMRVGGGEEREILGAREGLTYRCLVPSTRLTDHVVCQIYAVLIA